MSDNLARPKKTAARPPRLLDPPSLEALQHPHRAGLCRLDQTIHYFPQQTASGLDGQAGAGVIFDVLTVVRNVSASTQAQAIHSPRICLKAATTSGRCRNCSGIRMIYTHVLNKGGHGVVSPLDR
jgi:hypothetical protein